MATDADQDADQPATPTGVIGRVRAWAGGSARRNRIVGVGFGAAVLITVGTWLALADWAAAPDPPTVAKALEAIDRGDNEEARAIIAGLDESTLSGSDYGGALYALGVLKSQDAESHWSPDRRREDYFVASRYLSEARAIGFPEGRVADGLFVLGKSLIESRQLKAGVEVLQQALDAGAQGEAELHLLLADAFLFAHAPDYERAVAEADLAIADPAATDEHRSLGLLLRSEALSGMNKADESLLAAEQASDKLFPARRAHAMAKARVKQLQQAIDAGQNFTVLKAQAKEALALAKQADQLSTHIGREVGFLLGVVAELTDDQETALKEYGELRRTQGTTPAGIAGAIAEADLRQAAGDVQPALESYRRALDALRTNGRYRSSVLPLEDVKRRIRDAHQRFLVQQQFGAALDLAGRAGDLVGATEQLIMRGATLRQWGDYLVASGERNGPRGRVTVSEGRKRLREAGVAFEKLARTRFATRNYADDLWDAAEAYTDGQGYAEVVRVLDKYLRYEPDLRNAQVLLSLGEAHLARGEDTAAIAAFEECLEYHNDDASSYSARIECAQAYHMQGNFDRAEELLRYNLTQTALTPLSPEWRASQFDLGHLLADAQRHDEAIVLLDEAIERAEQYFPDDPRIRPARYQVAMSHRAAARAPLQRFTEAKTVSERERARVEADAHLEAALLNFEIVQQELTLAESGDELDRATLRNCYVLGGDVLFELGRFNEAIGKFASVSTLYQDEPFMLQAYVHIYHCWRRLSDPPKARGVIQQARLLLDRLPDDADFVSATSLNRREWERLLSQLDLF